MAESRLGVDDYRTKSGLPMVVGDYPVFVDDYRGSITVASVYLLLSVTLRPRLQLETNVRLFVDWVQQSHRADVSCG